MAAEVLLEGVVDDWKRLTNDLSGHEIVVGDLVYVQPHVYLVAHLVEMWAAGWDDMDFDTLAAVSGASALWGYQPKEFMPKYAHVTVDIDERIATATGFGYEWVSWDGAEGAWVALCANIDAGMPLKGWDWENCMFAGYRTAEKAEDRQVFMMADGPGTLAEWRTWEQYMEWVNRMGDWKQNSYGRHTGRVPALPAKDIALRVIRDLVAWSTEPPSNVSERFSEAVFGLAGIEAYARDCGDMETYEDWGICHGHNPMWTMRNSTAVYLEGVVEAGLLPEEPTSHVAGAAEHYRECFTAWDGFYELLGHSCAEGAGKNPETRVAGSALARQWLGSETAAVGELKVALELVEG